MRNIEFKEDQGPGFWRRLLALLIILLCLTAAAGYRYFFVSAEYCTSMTLLAKDAAACDRLLADTLRDRDGLLLRMNGKSASSAQPVSILDLSPEELPQAEERPAVARPITTTGTGRTGSTGGTGGTGSTGAEGAGDAGGVRDSGDHFTRLMNAIIPDRAWCEAALQGLSVEKKPEGLLVLQCREHAPAFQAGSLAGQQVLQTVLRSMEQAALDADLQNIQNLKARATQRQQELAREAGTLPTQFELRQEVAAALRELNATGLGKDWPGGSWPEAFPKTPELSRLVTALEKQLDQARELSRQIIRDRELSASVEKWVNAPENQSVTRKTKRIVYHEDTPELIRVRDLKAELEAQRMRLLQRATTKHPLARKLSAQIDELQAQIEALTRLPEVVEDVVEETNPEMNSWQKQLADATAAIRGAEAKLGLVRQNILSLTAQLQTAEERQRLLQLQNEKLRVQSLLKEAAENVPASAGLPFTVFLPAGKPQLAQQPAAWPLYGGALAVGLCCAVLLLLTRRKTRFGVFEKPEEILPEYPVLGSIPRFDGRLNAEGLHATDAHVGDTKKESA